MPFNLDLVFTNEAVANVPCRWRLYRFDILRPHNPTDIQLIKAQPIRDSEWRLDFVAAENSMGFHADQEAARILAEAIDYARLGEIEVQRSIE